MHLQYFNMKTIKNMKTSKLSEIKKYCLFILLNIYRERDRYRKKKKRK